MFEININRDGIWKEKFEDTKGATRSRKSKKDRHHNDQMKNDKGMKMIYKTLHRELKIEQHESN